MSRLCKKCNKELDDSCFERFKSTHNEIVHRRHTCKKCRYPDKRVWEKEHYRKNKEKIKERVNRRKSTEEGMNALKSSYLKHEYGITLKEYYETLNKQNGVCAICFGKELLSGKKYMAVDHNHSTGKVRGILCNRCNSGLGFFKDDIKLFYSAIKYIESDK